MGGKSFARYNSIILPTLCYALYYKILSITLTTDRLKIEKKVADAASGNMKSKIQQRETQRAAERPYPFRTELIHCTGAVICFRFSGVGSHHNARYCGGTHPPVGARQSEIDWVRK